MIQKIRNIALTLGMVSVALLPVAALPSAAFAQGVDSQKLNANLCQGSNFDISSTNGNNANCVAGANQSNLQTLLTNIINYFSIIVGVIAVIMIIVGGLRYITSGGDSGKVGSAKTTIIYALVGLVIVALSQLIVHFVLGGANNVVSGG